MGFPATQSGVEIEILKMGPRIDLEEAPAIQGRACEAGLVTQPASSQNPGGMCNCCGDCCGPLSALNYHPKPARIVFSNYFARIDADACNGCGLCQERCQMGAIGLGADERAGIDLDRCIGCGLCVTTCPEQALSLIKKPEKRLKHRRPMHLNRWCRWPGKEEFCKSNEKTTG